MSLQRPSKEAISNASVEELASTAAGLLKSLEPGKLPLDLFKELSRLMVLSTVEVIPFRAKSSEIEVLLGQRPENDVWWPSQWHLPGSVLLPTDEEVTLHDYDTPADRILDGEFSGSIERVSDVHVFDAQRRSGIRGSEQTVFCWTEVDLSPDAAEASGGRFFEASRILVEPPSEGLIEGHDATIQRAVDHYLAFAR